MMPLEARARPLTTAPESPGPVVYWMSRDQRTRDNWALLFAQALALRRRAPLCVAFCLAPSFPGAALRHYDFLLRGLAETAAALAARRIGFALLEGEPARELPAFLERVGAGALVGDFDPLRVKRAWQREVAAAVRSPSTRSTPTTSSPAGWRRRSASSRRAPSGRRSSGSSADWLHEFPPLRAHPHPWRGPGRRRRMSQRRCAASRPDPSVPPVAWIAPGERAARRRSRRSCGNGSPATTRGATTRRWTASPGSRPGCTSASSRRSGSRWRCARRAARTRTAPHSWRS